MGHPRFYLISDRKRMGSDPFAVPLRLARLGLPAFQWREKDLGPLETYDALCRATTLWRAAGVCTRLMVNDRVDIAAMLNLGVHLPENGLPVRAARRVLPSEAWVARSAHSLDGAIRAQQDGADFAMFGPIYETESKRTYGPPRGLEELRMVASTLGAFPVVAVGGITPERIAACLDAGASGVAAIGAIWDTLDPIAAYERFARALDLPVCS